jgi:hypothetical protein
MANTRAGNVIRIDTSADFSDVRDIVAIKYIGAASGTATIKRENTSGDIMWSESGTTNIFNEVQMRSPDGFRFEVTNSAVLLIYCRIK